MLRLIPYVFPPEWCGSHLQDARWQVKVSGLVLIDMLCADVVPFQSEDSVKNLARKGRPPNGKGTDRRAALQDAEVGEPAGGCIRRVEDGPISGAEGGVKDESGKGAETIDVGFERHVGVQSDDSGVSSRAAVEHIATGFKTSEQFEPRDSWKSRA